MIFTAWTSIIIIIINRKKYAFLPGLRPFVAFLLSQTYV